MCDAYGWLDPSSTFVTLNDDVKSTIWVADFRSVLELDLPLNPPVVIEWLK